jgi:WD40 repeat protein
MPGVGQSGEVKRALNAHSGWVNAVAWSHCGKWLASGGDDKMVFVLCHSSQVLARNVYKRWATATLKMLQVVTEKFMLQVLQKIYAYVCSI